MPQSSLPALEWLLFAGARLCLAQPNDPRIHDIRIARRVSLADAYAAVEAAQITDSLTVAAIYKVVLMEMRGEV